MNRGPIFVLGLMRSGTTFVQRVLNCHPDVTIWGEHGGALRSLLTGLEPFTFDDHHREQIQRGYKRRREVIGQLRDTDAFDAYVSPVPPEAYESLVDDVVRAHLEALFTLGLGDDARWGFKETRYAGSVYGPLARVFPEAHFVFVVRSPSPWMSSVVRAPFRKDLRPEQLDDGLVVNDALGALADLWVGRTRASVQFAEADPARRIVVLHEDLHSPEAAMRLSARLGLGGLPEATLAKVLGSRAGSSDLAPDWDESSRDQLEQLILAAVEGDSRLAALQSRARKVSLR